MQRDYLTRFHRDGFAVIRGVFGRQDLSALSDAFDRVKSEGMRLKGSFRHQNVFFQLSRDESLGRTLRMVQWPSYFDDVLNRFRLDKRLFEIVQPLIGDDLKQIINQMHWKQPGAAQSSFGFHQDIWFRRPRLAYRNPASAYIQSAIAIDPHTEENGAMVFCPGSHERGELSIDADGRVMDRSMSEDDLRKIGLSPADAVTLELEPGDVAIWSLFTVHGSGPNTSTQDRRVYLNGYVTAEDCDRGEWAFRDGEPCTLGEPVLVHYEDLYSRPEPHFPDEA